MFNSVEIEIEVESAEDDWAIITVSTPIGTISIAGALRWEGRLLYVTGAHIGGLSRGALGRSGLNAVARKLLEVADVDKPILFFYKEGHVTSRLVAPYGRVRTDTHVVETWGGVTIVSSDSSTLTTERLRYDPKTQKISSTDTVHLEKPDSITDGVGLETDPGLQKVKMGRQKVRFKKGMLH